MEHTTDTARIVKFHQYGAPEVLKVEAVDRPEPGAGEVRVQMRALALNRANSMFRDGTYLFEASFPSRNGTEGVGLIDAVGEGVTDFQAGQRVNLLPPGNESEAGYAADFNIVHQNFLLEAPEGLDDRQAATAWVPFLTLYHHLCRTGSGCQRSLDCAACSEQQCFAGGEQSRAPPWCEDHRFDPNLSQEAGAYVGQL